MRKIALLTGIFMITAFAGQMSAIAKDKPGAPNDWNRRHWKDKADTNQDGTVNKDERQAAKAIYAEKRQDWKEKVKAKADTNDDGKVDEAEREVAKTRVKEKLGTWKEKADKNKDGRVDRLEKQKALGRDPQRRGKRY